MFAALVDERVLVNPTNASGVRSDDRIDTFWQGTSHRVQIFDYSRPGPINVRTILKDDVNERFTEHRFTANKFNLRRRNKFGRDRVGNLIFNQVGRTAFPIGINNDLNVAQIGNRIERSLVQSIDPTRNPEYHEYD